MMFQNNLAFAKELDDKDQLKSFRNKFVLPSHSNEAAIYFLGNSLGLQPKQATGYINEILEQWGKYGVEGFFTGDKPWMEYHNLLTRPLARIVGALPNEIVVMNQLTVNLHLMMVSFYRPMGKRNKILCESGAFPSDQYMLETHVRERGLNPDDVIIEVKPREGEFIIRNEDIFETIEKNKNELSLVLWGGVNYYTGQVFDMKQIAAHARKAGAKIGYDLAHAAGNISIKLHDWDVDFACWCSYKYLNSGPGAMGGAYVHERYHNDPTLKRFAGWWGYKKETRFLMQKGFDPIPTAEGWQLSTPSPILYALQKASLDIFEEAGIENIIEKGQKLSDYLLFLLNYHNKENKETYLKIITPASREEKGCQISMLMFKNGKKIFEHLAACGVFADWRDPDVIRVAPVPLYNTFEEIWQYSEILSQAIKKINK